MKNEKGFALILVILILSVLIALVTEFAYSVHNETVSLYTWRDMQRLSLEAETGAEMGETFLKRLYKLKPYSYPERFDVPVPDIGGDETDSMLISIVDESGKLNINRMVNANQTTNDKGYASTKRLFEILSLDPTLIDRIYDWIDKDSEERVRGSERKAKNGYLYSIDELLQIDGITEDVYKKLIPHVTIFGNGQINMNSAGKYVLMSLSDEINEVLAERVVSYRELKAFEELADLDKVAGFNTIRQKLMGRIGVKGTVFSIHATCYQGELKRTIQSVLEFDKNEGFKYSYWKEI